MFCLKSKLQSKFFLSTSYYRVKVFSAAEVFVWQSAGPAMVYISHRHNCAVCVAGETSTGDPLYLF